MLERLEPDWPGRASAINGALEAKDGQIKVPGGPGLGVTLNEAFIAAHPSMRNTAIASGGWNTGTENERVYTQTRRQRAELLNRSGGE